MLDKVLWSFGLARRKLVQFSQDALLDVCEELAQERADRLIKAENAHLRQSQASIKGWQTRRSRKEAA